MAIKITEHAAPYYLQIHIAFAVLVYTIHSPTYSVRTLTNRFHTESKNKIGQKKKNGIGILIDCCE